MKIYLLGITALIGASQALAQIPVPVEGWPYIVNPVNFYIYSLPRFGYDNSGLHLYFNTLTGEVDKFHLDGTFYQGWPSDFDSLKFDPTPIIVDIDHDGFPEVVTSAKTNWDHIYSLLYLIDNDGSVMPGFPLQTIWPLFVNVADLDADNEYEIIAYDPRGETIYCLDRFGNHKPGWPIYFHMPGIEQALTGGTALGDFDLDGTIEFLVSGFQQIHVFRHGGTPQPGFPIILQEDSSFTYGNNGAPPNLADFDADGYLEIITSGDNWNPSNPYNFRSFIIIYEHDGAVKSGWPHYFESTFINHTPTPGDINGDGLLEIGFRQVDLLIYVDINFNTLPSWPISTYSPSGYVRGSTSDLITVDLDGDGDCEIFMDHGRFYADSLGQDSLWYYGHSYLFAIDHLGIDLSGYPIEVNGVYFRMPPTFARDPASNHLYMSLATEFMMPDWMDTIFVELYQFPDSTGPTTQWPMLGHDNLMTRNYNFVDRVTSINDEGREILPKNYILKQNYPNPFNYSTIIEFTLPKEEHVTLTIYDILGRKVLDIYDQVMTAGTHRHRLSMDVPSGIYLYRLKAENAEITRKMTLVK